MTGFVNRLTKAEEEMLTITMEECSEVIKACSKILRYGRYFPLRRENCTAIESLQEEAADVVACFGVLVKNGFLNADEMNDNARFKLSLLKNPNERRVHFITPEMIP